MAIIEWRDDYSVDIQEIDEQHKCIVNYINELGDALIRKGNQVAVYDVVNKLVEYTKIHFAVEETLMRIFTYQGYNEHKISHDMLVLQLSSLQKKLYDGHPEVGMELMMLLKKWLLEHISHEDKQYTAALHAAGVKKRWLKKFW